MTETKAPPEALPPDICPVCRSRMRMYLGKYKCMNFKAHFRGRRKGL